MSEEKNDRLPIGKIIESSLISVAAYFPIAGSIAAGWNEYKNYRQTKHIEGIISDYAKRLEELNEQVDKNYLHTEEAKRLVERTATIGKDESREDKRKMLSEFLAHSSTVSLSHDPEKDMVLDTIDRISPLQSKLLSTITQLIVLQWGRGNVKLGSDYDPAAEKKPTFGYIIESSLVQMNGINHTKENIEASLDYMTSIGVIEVHSARGWTQVGGKIGIKGYRPTKLGLKVLEYLGVNVDLMHENPEFIAKNSTQ
jgi:hypothetical protein